MESALQLISDLLKSPLVHILTTFLLTSIVGAKFANKYQERRWLYQKELSDRDDERDRAEMAFQEISSLMDRRLYRMRQVLWSLNRGDSTRLEEKLSEYRQVLYEWNDKNNVVMSKIEQYFGYERRKHFEFRISRDFIYIGMLLERWCNDNDDHPSFSELFTMIDTLNGLAYNLDKLMLADIQSGNVGQFRGKPFVKPKVSVFRDLFA